MILINDIKMVVRRSLSDVKMVIRCSLNEIKKVSRFALNDIKMVLKLKKAVDIKIFLFVFGSRTCH